MKTTADAKNLIARYRKIPRYVDNVIGHLRAGAADGLVADAEVLRRVVVLVVAQLARPVAEWQMLAPLEAKGAASAWTPALRAELTAVVEKEIKPAGERYLAFLKTELTPKVRKGDRPGIAHLSVGKECYLAQITNFLGEARTAARQALGEERAEHAGRADDEGARGVDLRHGWEPTSRGCGGIRVHSDLAPRPVLPTPPPSTFCAPTLDEDRLSAPAGRVVG